MASVIVRDTPPPPVGQSRRSARHMRQREAGSTPEVPLNARQVENAYKALSHPFVRMCLNEVTKRLFSAKSIVCVRGDKPLQLSDAFERAIRSHFVPLARDALNAMLVYGVVPLAFRRVKDGLGEESLVPYVPRHGTFVITTRAEAGVQHYGFFWGAPEAVGTRADVHATDGAFGEEDTHVLINDTFGFSPALDGTLESNMHTIVERLRLIDTLDALALVAEDTRAKPPLVTQYNLEVDKMARGEKNSADFYATAPDACIDAEQLRYERSAREDRAMRESVRALGHLHGRDMRADFAGNDALGSLGTEVREAYERSCGLIGRVATTGGARYRLGSTDTFVATQLPEVRSDLNTLTEQAMHIVCGVLNVPFGALATSQTVRAGVEASAEDMQRTVSAYADSLARLLTGAYNHIFGVADMRTELRARASARARSSDEPVDRLLSEADITAASREVNVELKFDLPPTTSNESLEFLRNRGLLSFERYAETKLRLNGFAASDIENPKKDFLNDEERKSLVLGTAGEQAKAKAAAGAGVGAGSKRASSGGDSRSEPAKKARAEHKTSTASATKQARDS